MKLNDTYEFPVYADDVNILGGIVYSIKKTTEALIVTVKGTSLDVTADKVNNNVPRSVGESRLLWGVF